MPSHIPPAASPPGEAAKAASPQQAVPPAEPSTDHGRDSPTQAAHSAGRLDPTRQGGPSQLPIQAIKDPH
jgi:hypothetical protein